MGRSSRHDAGKGRGHGAGKGAGKSAGKGIVKGMSRFECASRALVKYVRWTRRKQVVYVHEFLREHRQFTMQDVKDVVLDSINRDYEFRFELLVRNTVPEDSIITCVDRCGFDNPRMEDRLRDLKRKAGEEEDRALQHRFGQLVSRKEKPAEDDVFLDRDSTRARCSSPVSYEVLADLADREEAEKDEKDEKDEKAEKAEKAEKDEKAEKAEPPPPSQAKKKAEKAEKAEPPPPSQATAATASAADTSVATPSHPRPPPPPLEQKATKAEPGVHGCDLAQQE